MYSFPNLEPVCCSMSSSNCCFLTCIQVSQEAGQVVWYSHLLQNFFFFDCVDHNKLYMLSCVQLFATPWTVATRLLCPWASPGNNTGVGCHALLQGIFPPQGSKRSLLHWQADSLPTSTTWEAQEIV